MSTLLSIRAAASEAPAALALISRRTRWTFAEAAEHVAEALAALGPRRAGAADVVSGHRTVATALRLWTALEARRPIALVHPQQPAHVQAQARDALAAWSVPEEAALVIFSSGTTGAPRGVLHRRDALEAAALAHEARLPWREDDRTLVALSLAAAGGVAALVRTLAARRTLVVLDEDEAWPLDAALRDAAITQASLVPAQLAGLLADAAWRPPPALREVLVGGAACPADVRRSAQARGVPIRLTYGLSETLGQVATQVDDDDGLAPLSGMTVVAGSRAAPTTIEICGPTTMIGYLGDAPLGDARLVTSDLGWLDERGRLHVVGRADDLIVTGGHKVAPTLVEDALRATPGVADACAFAVPHPRWGQIIAAAIVTREGFDLVAAAARWRTQLPAHHRPRRLAVLPELPRNANGKIDRARLADAALVDVPYPATSSSR